MFTIQTRAQLTLEKYVGREYFRFDNFEQKYSSGHARRGRCLMAVPRFMRAPRVYNSPQTVRR